ncbi:hypothetical protein E3Q14_03115 [Wallemia mellicola]|nr:hypothetical protein E3Q14_03115 [Wallemia mellicola]
MKALAKHDITVHSTIALDPHIHPFIKDSNKIWGSELLQISLNRMKKKVLKYRDHVLVTLVPIDFSAGVL